MPRCWPSWQPTPDWAPFQNRRREVDRRISVVVLSTIMPCAVTGRAQPGLRQQVGSLSYGNTMSFHRTMFQVTAIGKHVTGNVPANQMRFLRPGTAAIERASCCNAARSTRRAHRHVAGLIGKCAGMRLGAALLYASALPVISAMIATSSLSRRSSSRVCEAMVAPGAAALRSRLASEAGVGCDLKEAQLGIQRENRHARSRANSWMKLTICWWTNC